MNPIQQTKLDVLMHLSSGSPEVVIGLIDGPVDFSHSDFIQSRLRTVKNSQLAYCKVADTIACSHGTFIAGILCANRDRASLPAICPECEILLRPVFFERLDNNKIIIPNTNPKELATAIMETINSGAKIINLSLGMSPNSLVNYRELEQVYDYACRHGVVIIAAAGNQGNIGSISLVNHPWVIPVAACNEQGQLSKLSNFGHSVKRHGLMAPGENITSTSSGGGYTQMSGTSVATPFVTGTVALLWSLFPKSTAAEVVQAVVNGSLDNGRNTITPSLLDAQRAWNLLKN